MSPRPHRSASIELQENNGERNDTNQSHDTKSGGTNGAFGNGRTEAPVINGKSGLSSVVNAGEQDEMEIYGYRPSLLLQIVTWIAILLTVGLLRIVFHWFEEWYLKSTHVPCSLDKATKILVVEIFQKKYRRVYVRQIKTLTAQNSLNSDQSEVGVKMTGDDHVLEDITTANKKLAIPMSDGSFLETDSVRMFTCKKMRYIWDPCLLQFFRLKGWGHGLATSAFHSAEAQQGMAGLSAREQARRRAVFDSNYIHVPVKSAIQLLFLEVINPFYVFQVFSVIIWFLISYYSFASAIIIISAAGIVSTIYQTRRNQKKLRSTVQGSDVVTVCRGDGNFETARTEELVPGDVIVIPPSGCVMHCDAVLLFGTCIVNESMLTGESVPVTKTPLPQRSDISYSTKEHARHTLFCGTRVVQTRYFKDEKVMAVVTCTGFMTSKGSLVSAIMYPPPVDFKFERDSYRFIAFLALLASVGFIYNVFARLANGETGKEVFLHSFDLITVCVPPALPAAMTAGIILAQKRLKKRRIYCISPRSINVSGSLNCVCFDKTGTLTEDGLDLWGVVPAIIKRGFLPPLKTPSKLPECLAAAQPVDHSTGSSAQSSAAYEPPVLLMGMATCHSLTTIDGVLSGDPLDLKMFEATGWSLTELSSEDTSKYDNICSTTVTGTHDGKKVDVGIIRQFPFSSALQRMAILCRIIEESHLHFICKGSPEMIQSLSRPETVPSDFADVLEEYTKQGYRVIALAHRTVELQSIHKLRNIQREDLEHDLTFLGLVILENRLKSDTSAIIGQLSDAAIRTIMVTGDNLLTAISVARDCGMVGANDQVVIINSTDSVDESTSRPKLEYTLAEKSMRFTSGVRVHSTPESNDQIALDVMPEEGSAVNGIGGEHLAVTGKSWAVIREHYPELVSRVAVKGTVFARMSPDQKQQLVQELQHLGYYVGMCGDGANDCGALKAAHAGIALSDSEASVASPFTSKDSSIACVPELVREGRCALVTSFGIFKYMAAYSLTQFISVMVLYNIGSNLTDTQFLYVDFILACGLCAFFGYNDPYPGPLHNKPPLTSLISPSPLGSLIIQILFVGLFQGFSLMLLSNQPWFVPFPEINNSSGFLTGDIACHENYAVFSMSMFQYIILALAFAKGKPYRTAFFRNLIFTGILLFLTAISLWVLLDPVEGLRWWLNLLMPPDWDFRWMMLGLSVVQMILSLLLEFFVVDCFLEPLPNTAFWKKFRPPKEKHLAVKRDLANESWPGSLCPNSLSSIPPYSPESEGTSS